MDYNSTLSLERAVTRTEHPATAALDAAANAPSDHPGFPATGRPYAMPCMHFCRMRGSLIAEHWSVRDQYGAPVGVAALPASSMPAGLGATR